MPRQFRIERPSMEVSSNHRPDTTWRFTDSHGHLHQWWHGDAAADTYNPTNSYHVPSVEWIVIHPETDYYPEEGYYSCTLCGERVNLGYTADTVAQYIRGPAKFYIDDLPVSKAEWFAEYKLDYPDSDLEDAYA